jgi:hypothetical protein
MEEKICIDCGKTLPLSTDHWHKAKDGSWEPRCKPCRSEYRKKHRRLRKRTMRKRREKALGRIEQEGVDMFAELSRTGGPLIPHSAEVLERLMEYFGGTSGFTAMVVKQYYDSVPGGSHRNKILEMVLRLVNVNVQQGGAKKPLNLWSEDELEQELDKRFKEVVIEYRGNTINETTVPQEDRAALPAPADADPLGLPPGGIEELAGRANEQADRSLEALQADSPAAGDARVPGE